MKYDLEMAHKKCLSNRKAIEKSDLCGCFYCLRFFKPKEIENWVKDKDGDTAICPYCFIDSVISENVGFEITSDFLEAMYVRWFT